MSKNYRIRSNRQRLWGPVDPDLRIRNRGSLLATLAKSLISAARDQNDFFAGSPVGAFLITINIILFEFVYEAA